MATKARQTDLDNLIERGNALSEQLERAKAQSARRRTAVEATVKRANKAQKLLDAVG